MFARILATLTIPILFLGCASPYKATTDNSAKIRFRTEAAVWVNVSTFANEKCAPNPDGEKLGAIGHGSHFTLVSAQPNDLNMLGSEVPTTKRIERVVRASQPFYFAFEHAYISSQGVGCNKTLSFIPQPGGEYEAEFVLTGATCDVQVSRLSNSKGLLQREREETTRVYSPTCRVQRAFNNPWN